MELTKHMPHGPMTTAEQRHEGAHFAEAETSTGLDHRKLGLWMFIASEVIFFASLIISFLVLRNRVPPNEIPHLNLEVASANTFILLASSFTMVLALAAIRDGLVQRSITLLIVTAALGIVFLGGQAFEYNILFTEGILPDQSIYAAAFFTTTGFHGTHVLIGVIWIAATIFRARRGGFSAQNNLGIEMAGLYWHFVDLVWVVLFTVIYLI